jgi:hypothetical protein
MKPRRAAIVFGQQYHFGSGTGSSIVLALRDCPDQKGNVQIENKGMVQSVRVGELRPVPKVVWVVSKWHPLFETARAVAARHGNSFEVND